MLGGSVETGSFDITDRDNDSCGSSGSVISSSDNEYSSSAEESDTESSESSTCGEFAVNMAEPEKMDTGMEVNDAVPETEGAADVADNVKLLNDKVNEMSELVEGRLENEPYEVDLEEGAVGGVDEGGDGDNGESDQNMDSDTFELKQEAYGDEFSSLPSKIGISGNEMDSIFDKLTKDDDIDIGFQEEISDMPPFSPDSDLFVVESRSDFPMPSLKNTTEDDDDDNKSFSSNDSVNGSDEEVVCTDSDVTDDNEDNVGEWNPSPVYEGDDHEQDESEMFDHGNVKSEVLEGYEYPEKSGAVGEDTELNNLRNNVKDLMAEVETLVHDDSDRMFLPSLYPVRSISEDEPAEFSEKIEVIHDKPTEYCKSSLSSKTQAGNNDPRHVEFFSPTNMIYFDPECPVIDRVSVEMNDNLNDPDDEERLKEVDSELEHQKIEDLEESLPYADEPGEDNEEGETHTEVQEGTENLEAAVVRELREVIGSLHAKGEIDLTGTLEQESEAVVMRHKPEPVRQVSVEEVQQVFDSLKDEDFSSQPTDENIVKESQDVTETEIKASESGQINDEEDVKDYIYLQHHDHIGLDQVELRKKKARESFVMDDDWDSMIIHDTEGDDVKVSRSEVQSMIVHDVENEGANIEAAIGSAEREAEMTVEREEELECHVQNNNYMAPSFNEDIPAFEQENVDNGEESERLVYENVMKEVNDNVTVPYESGSLDTEVTNGTCVEAHELLETQTVDKSDVVETDQSVIESETVESVNDTVQAQETNALSEPARSPTKSSVVNRKSAIRRQAEELAKKAALEGNYIVQV